MVRHGFGCGWDAWLVLRFIILCWYHLGKRVCEGLSGVGAAKEERKLLQRTILGFLWTGNVDDAVEALKVRWRITRVVSRRDCG